MRARVCVHHRMFTDLNLVYNFQMKHEVGAHVYMCVCDIMCVIPCVWVSVCVCTRVYTCVEKRTGFGC